LSWDIYFIKYWITIVRFLIILNIPLAIPWFHFFWHPDSIGCFGAGTLAVTKRKINKGSIFPINASLPWNGCRHCRDTWIFSRISGTFLLYQVICHCFYHIIIVPLLLYQKIIHNLLKVMLEPNLTIAILFVWSWSLLQFCLVMGGSHRGRKSRWELSNF
jgi:hypothetical protein